MRTDQLENSKGSFSAENGHGIIWGFCLPGNSVSTRVLAFGIKQDVFECVLNLHLLHIPDAAPIPSLGDLLNILTYTWHCYRTRKIYRHAGDRATFPPLHLICSYSVSPHWRALRAGAMLYNKPKTVANTHRGLPRCTGSAFRELRIPPRRRDQCADEYFPRIMQGEET